MNDLISVIVPVYNKEETIERALLSLKKQTYRNIQVIIIDDGSTDHSADLIKEICYGDNRFQSYYQTNKGVSAARNLGLKKVKGKYVSFLDADDYLESNYLENLYKFHELPLVATGFTQVGNKTKTIDAKNKIVTENEIEDFVFTKTNFKFMCVVWAKLFQFKYIKENNLKFDETISIGEDSIFVIKYLKLCKQLCVLDMHGYNNMMSSGTLSRGNIHNFWKANQKLIKNVQQCFDISYNKTWTFLYLRGIKIYLSNNLKNYQTFKSTFDWINSQDDTKLLKIDLLEDKTDKIIFLMLKLKCTRIFYLLLKIVNQ